MRTTKTKARALKAAVATVACAAIICGSALAASSVYTMDVHEPGNEAMKEAIVQIGEGVTGTVTQYNTTGIYNPHRNHRSNEECTTCHIPDSDPVLTCTMCHEIQLPEGWTNYYDAKN